MENFDKDKVREIRDSWNRIKDLKEEIAAIRENIKDEKNETAKKVNLDKKSLNRIYKYVEIKEKGDWDDDDVDVAEQITGI